jgi:hypothetical protein
MNVWRETTLVVTTRSATTRRMGTSVDVCQAFQKKRASVLVCWCYEVIHFTCKLQSVCSPVTYDQPCTRFYSLRRGCWNLKFTYISCILWVLELPVINSTLKLAITHVSLLSLPWTPSAFRRLLVVFIGSYSKIVCRIRIEYTLWFFLH